MDNRFEILKPENYHSYLPLDIAAVHYSEPGAMGYHGVLRIITPDKHMFMVQYLHDQWEKQDIALVCPVISEFQTIMGDLNENWASFYMGFGNHLYVKKELAGKLKFDGLAPHEIYSTWIDSVLDIL